MRRTILLLTMAGVLLLACTSVVLAQQTTPAKDFVKKESAPSKKDLAAPESRDFKPTIVDGQPADQGEYPAQGFLRIEFEPDKFSSCGGTLVDTIHFLTAAHCVVDNSGNEFSPGSFLITLGKVDLNAVTPEDEYGVSGVEAHEDFNPDTFENDVAILTLDEPANFTPTRVVEANETNLWLSDPDKSITATIIGWGRTGFLDPASDVLLEANVPMRSDQVMTNAYEGQFRKFNQLLMVGAGDGNGDTCAGDSGGPLLVPDTATAPPNDFALAGITSFGFGCNDPDFPGVYTRIGAEPLNTWVHDRIGNDPPTANDDDFSVDEDQTLAVDPPGVLLNDSDPDSDPLTAILASEPANGTLTLDPDGSFSYEPDPNFNGTDSFTYEASDGQGGTDTATAAIEVRPVDEPQPPKDKKKDKKKKHKKKGHGKKKGGYGGRGGGGGGITQGSS